MQWLILILASCLAFGFCMLVFALKGRRNGASTGMHTCGHSHGCQCQNKPDKRQDCGNIGGFGKS